MKAVTHIISGMVGAEAALLYYKFPLAMDAYFSSADLAASFVMTVMPVMIGAVFPDIDINIGPKRIDRNGRIYPGKYHRTFAHWPPFYLLLAAISVHFSVYILWGFSLAALGHLLLDAFTRTGVPLFYPMGRKYGFDLVTSGDLGEVAMSVGLLLLGFTLFHCMT